MRKLPVRAPHHYQTTRDIFCFWISYYVWQHVLYEVSTRLIQNIPMPMYDPQMSGSDTEQPLLAGGGGDVNVHEEQEHGGGPKKPFIKSHGLTTVEADELLRRYGRNELEEKKTPKWLIFVSQLYEPMVCTFAHCLKLN